MARIDYVELPSVTAHELTRGFYAKAFGLQFTDFGPDYSATTSGDVDLGLNGPPVCCNARRSSFSQRGAHWAGSLRSAMTMSASAQAAMNLRQSMKVEERVARMCQLCPPRSTRATQASRLQLAKSLAARKPGSPS